MGKFLAGVVVGLVAFEIALIYGYGANNIPNHLPDDKQLDRSCCQKPDFYLDKPKINRVLPSLRRKTAII
jgi:hypothetical protein